MWFIRQPDGTEAGPFSEQHIRAWVYRSDTERSWVRQGDSEWRLAIDVRKIFDELRINGTYLSDSREVFGPFTASRAEQLIRSSDGKYTHLRNGICGDWSPLFGHEPVQEFANDGFPNSIHSDARHVPPFRFNDSKYSGNRPAVSLTRIPKRFRNYIQNGETVLYASNPSENARILSMIFSGAVAGVPLMFSFVGTLLSREFMALIFSLIFGLMAVWLCAYIAHLHWKHRYYIITDSRTIVSQGIFNIAVRIVFNQNIQMISVNTGLIDRWLDLNTIELSTAGAGGGFSIFSAFRGMSPGSVQLRWVADAPSVVGLISS